MNNMSRGRRYNSEPKLNIKKVIATILVLAVIIMIIIVSIKANKKPNNKADMKKTVTNSYISVFQNGKWGVINSKGEIVIEPTYDNMLIIPDANEPIFICQTDVDLEKGTYKSYAIDDKSNKIFGNYETIEAIQNIDKDNNVFYDANALIVSNNRKYGLINFSGKQLLECKYDKIEPIKYIKNSLMIQLDNKKGISDNSGNIIAEPTYSDVQALTDRYEDGYIVKNSKGLNGVINYNKKQTLDCKYSKIENIYGNEMYFVTENNNKEVIKSGGEIVVKNNFDSVNEINTNITYKKSNKYGVMTTSGEIKLKPEFDDLKFLYNNKYIAKKDGRYGVIDLDNNTIVNFDYDNIKYLSDEGFIEADKENTTYLMNTDFEIKCQGIVSEINSKNKYIKIRVNDEYKYYNFRLEEKDIKDIYPANTLFLSKQNGKYGFVNKKGIVIVDYIYDDATEQNEYGYSAIKKDGKWGAIDSEGKIVVEPTLELSQNTVINFIGKWHLAPDLNANYYTDAKE